MPYRVLVLAPHTDDAEIGAGGTIARFIDEGSQVHVATFSIATESLPDGVPPDTLKCECQEALSVLGIPSSNITIFDFPVRLFSSYRQAILEELITIKKALNPELIILPSANDIHQDHQVIHAEGVRAFKQCILFGYELPWNNLVSAPQLFITLQQKHIDKKWKALECYHSQIKLKRPYVQKEYIHSWAHVRGVQIQENLAEAFDVIRLKIG